jgi:hypothetical protein
MSGRLNLEALGTYKTTTNERKGTLYSTTNLYAIAYNALTAPTPINQRYWWSIDPNEIWVLFAFSII